MPAAATTPTPTAGLRGASRVRSEAAHGSGAASVRVWRPAALPGVEVLHEHASVALRRLHFDVYALSSGVVVDTDARYRGLAYTVTSGTVHLGEPGELYAAVRQRRPCTVQVLLLAPAVLDDAAEALGARGPVHFRAEGRAPLLADADAYGALGALHGAVAAGAAPLALEGLLTRALARVLAQSAERRRSAPGASGAPRADAPAVARARELLHARWAEPVRLAELAAAAGRHPVYLAETFRRALGVAPHQYQVQLRVARARRMLASGTPAARTALECGFADQAHLTRHFRRAVGLTPGAYARAAG